MADRNCLSFLIMLSHMIIIFVNGRKAEFMHEGTVKTIQSKDGDVIDCVDINKQPAFSHPLLKNHTIQPKPRVDSRGFESDNNRNMLFQSWHENGQCPEGTIPIARTQNYNLLRRRSYPAVLPKKQQNQSLEFKAPSGHEYAQVSLLSGYYYGARASITVWNPATEKGESSVSQIWVVSGEENDLNSMEAGWMASSGEKKTRFFIYWTSDGYQSTGCYNLLCPGFVQTNSKIVLGLPIEPLSTYGGEQFEIVISIKKLKKDGNWWLQLQDQLIGYWPRSLFTTLTDRSTAINWGGVITNTKSEGHHTPTQMGSGHFPDEGIGKASYFGQLGFVDVYGAMRDPGFLLSYASNPSCYNLHIPNDKKYGVYFFYGGPGYYKNCQ